MPATSDGQGSFSPYRPLFPPPYNLTHPQPSGALLPTTGPRSLRQPALERDYPTDFPVRQLGQQNALLVRNGLWHSDNVHLVSSAALPNPSPTRPTTRQAQRPTGSRKAGCCTATGARQTGDVALLASREVGSLTRPGGPPLLWAKDVHSLPPPGCSCPGGR